MSLSHKLAQLHAHSIEGAEQVKLIEACIEESQDEYKQTLLHKVADVNIEGIFSQSQEENFQELNQAFLSAIYDLPEIERPKMLELYDQYVAMLTEIGLMQKAVNTSIKAITEELK